MASDYTPNRRYPLYVATDKPNLRDQYNQAIREIDADIKQSLDDSSGVATALGSGFDAQHTVRMAIDDLDETVEGYETAIANEATARQNADTSLSNAISAEATARQNAINALSTDISDEVTARRNADTALSDDISAEATARQNADTTLNNAITSESTARQSADTLINTALSNLNSIIPSSAFSSSNTVKDYIDDNLGTSQGNVIKYGGATETYNLDWYQIFKDCYENDHGIYFPSGVYYIDSRIVLDAATFYKDGLPLPIRGDGAILKFSGSTTAIVNDASDGNGYCSVSGLVFSDENLSVQNALVNNKANGMRVSDCHFIGFDIAIVSTILGLVVIDCVFDGTPNTPPATPGAQGYGNPRGIAISATTDNVITGCKAFWLEMFAECRQSNIITNNNFYSPANSITTYFVGHRTDHIYASVIANNMIDTCCVCVLNAYRNVIFTNNVILWDRTLQNKTAYIFATNNNNTAHNLVFSENSISDPDPEVWTVAQWGLLGSATSFKLRNYISRDNRIFQRLKPENGTTRKFKLFCGINTAEFYFEPEKYFKITPLCTDDIYRFWPVTVPNMVLGGSRGITNSEAWFTTISVARYYKDDASDTSAAGYTNIAMNSIGSLTYSGPACYYEETGNSANTVVTTIPAGYTLRPNKQIPWNAVTPTP